MTARPSAAEQEFSAFAAARAQALARTAYLLTGDGAGAEDLVQTTLFHTAKVWRRLKGEPEVYARRFMYSAYMSQWRWPYLRAAPVSDVPERPYAAADLDARSVLGSALSRLTRTQRAALVLRFFDDVADMPGGAFGILHEQSHHALERLPLLAPELADRPGGVAVATDELRRLMEASGAQAPPVRVLPDTWRRARHARAFELLVIRVLIVLVLVLAAASIGSLVRANQGYVPADDAGAPALPQQVFAMPTWVRPTDDLEVGRLSLVWAAPARPGVVGVRAEDGAYVALDLPGYRARTEAQTTQGQDLVLAPDGETLAYATQDRSDTGEYWLAVVYLDSGNLVRLSTGSAAPVDTLSWDVSGRYVTFRAHASRGSGAGRPGTWWSVDVVTGRPERWPVAHHLPAAMGTDGRSIVAVRASGAVVRVSHLGTRTHLGDLLTPPAVAGVLDSPGGVVVTGQDAIVLLPPSGVPRMLGPAGGDDATSIAATANTVLAFTGSTGRLSTYHLGVGGPDRTDERALFTDRESGSVTSLSVAADLLDAAPRDFDEPDWPTDPRLYALASAGVLLAGAVLVWRRRPRPVPR